MKVSGTQIMSQSSEVSINLTLGLTTVSVFCPKNNNKVDAIDKPDSFEAFMSKLDKAPR